MFVPGPVNCVFSKVISLGEKRTISGEVAVELNIFNSETKTGKVCGAL